MNDPKCRLPTLITEVNRGSVQSAFQSHLFYSFIPELYLFEITRCNIGLYSKWHRIKVVGRDGAVGISTRYGLDGPRIESRWGSRFSALVQTGPGSHPASYTMGTESFPGAKRQRRGVGHPTPSSVEVKERVELYLYSASGPSLSVVG